MGAPQGVSCLCNCQSGVWARLTALNAFEAIDLSGIADSGPDGQCTAVMRTKVRSYVYTAPSDSLLILSGQIGTADVDGSEGGICILVDGRLCGAQSVAHRYKSGSASCIFPVSTGHHIIKIIGVHNLGLSRFIAGFSSFPL